MRFKITPVVVIFVVIVATWGCSMSNKKEMQPNILFIAIDDMNDWTGFLGGHQQSITPNLDNLANKGINFTNAHCPAPGCSPSRNALLYGVEPFNSGLYPFYDHEIHKQLMGKYISLPRLLKENGYETYGAGKIHHGSTKDVREWTEYYENKHLEQEFREGYGYQIGNNMKMSFRPTFHPDEDHIDHQVASYGIDILNKKHDKPFFLAVGIVKPHLPFDAPIRFFESLPDSIAAPAILKNDLADIPQEGNRLRKRAQAFYKDKAWEDVRRAYLACISWADYNIGRVIDELEKSPYADNTVVVVWSDHGYHLGEKMAFKKFTLWEEATRVPFIIYDGRVKDKGINCDQSVSLINIYKTLADMAGVVAPDYVDGESLVQQLKNPDKELVKPAIISWGKGNYAVRTNEWRYIRYHDGTEELYAHKSDSNEWHNLASKPEFEAVKMELAKSLPNNEAPIVEDYISNWSIEGADRERLRKSGNKTKKKNKK